MLSFSPMDMGLCVACSDMPAKSMLSQTTTYLPALD